MQRSCDACGKPYVAQRSTSKYCSADCRRRKAAGRVIQMHDPEPPSTKVGPLKLATRAQLDAAGRLESVEGVLALTLAGRVDSAPPQSLAGISKEFRAALAEALAGAFAADDPIDMLRARRDRKRGA